MIIDEYLFPTDTLGRDIAYIAVGLALLFLTGVDTPLANMSLERVFPDQVEDDHSERLLANSATDL